MGAKGMVKGMVLGALALAVGSCVATDQSCAVDNGGCGADAVCTELDGEATCACSSGYEGDGLTCTDVDECVGGTHGCDPLATCVNAEGTFTCECPEGYGGDGTACADVDECAEGTDACDPVATCTNSEGSYSCECPPGYEGDGFTCEDVVASLHGLRWELPCQPHEADSLDCLNDPDTYSTSTKLSGTEGTTYDVTLRFRGVVEEQTYVDGITVDGHWQVGGSPQHTGWNIYSLTVSSPAMVYYLNAGAAGQFVCYGIDYQQTIQVDAGATVDLFADTVGGSEIANRDADGNPIYVEDVPPWPEWYDGQFVQMDVVSVAPAP